MKKGLIVRVYDKQGNSYPALFNCITDEGAMVRPLNSWSAMCRVVDPGSIGYEYSVDKNGRVSQGIYG